MRLVVQRVNEASVIVDNNVISKIARGYLVLLGIKQGDTKAQADSLAIKLSKLRVMGDAQEKMNLSLVDAGAKVLIVSQFTLYADTSKGNRPSFVKAAKLSDANKLYKYFIQKLTKLGIETEAGSFGDYMKIKSELDGPVTILLEE